MPQAGNITVKKNDGTTDITYAVVIPSSGDKNPAVYRGPQGVAPLYKPELRIQSQSNAAGTSRQVSGTFKYPITVTATDGSTRQSHLPRMEVVVYEPQAVSQGDLDEFISQGLNLFASAAFKDSCKAGYAPT